MNKAYLSLGSNIEDRFFHIKRAVSLMDNMKGTKVEKVSKVYETKPVGLIKQDDFLNAAVKIDTDLEPLFLLERIQEIEKELKRERTVKWGPRTIDIDILLYKDANGNDLKINTADLTIPHPEMTKRMFVLVPLMDIMDISKAENIGIKIFAENLKSKRIYRQEI